MSGSIGIGIPPGTQWLQQARQPAQTHQQVLAGLSPQDQGLLQQIAVDTPAQGSWQYSIQPDPEGAIDEDGNPMFQLRGSSPSTDQWDHFATGNIDTLIQGLKHLRGGSWK